MNALFHSPGVELVVVAIVLVLFGATTGLVIARTQVRSPVIVDLTIRIRTWWVMVAVFSTALLLGSGATIVFLALVSFLALRDYFSIVPLRAVDRGGVVSAYGAIVAHHWLIVSGWSGLASFFVPAFALIAIPLTLLRTGQTDGFLLRLVTISWGTLAFAYGLGHLALIHAHGEVANPVAGGAGLMLFLVVVAQGSDVCQYLVGKAVGRRKIAVKISPNKTLAGFVAGLVAAIAIAWILGPHLTPLTGQEAVLAGVLIGIMGFVGDLTMSAIKRDLGRKDAGSLLPGHGGVLDRVDSLVLTAPAFHVFLLTGI